MLKLLTGPVAGELLTVGMHYALFCEVRSIGGRLTARTGAPGGSSMGAKRISYIVAFQLWIKDKLVVFPDE